MYTSIHSKYVQQLTFLCMSTQLSLVHLRQARKRAIWNSGSSEIATHFVCNNILLEEDYATIMTMTTKNINLENGARIVRYFRPFAAEFERAKNFRVLPLTFLEACSKWILQQKQ